MSEIIWAYYPKSDSAPAHLRRVVEVFIGRHKEINSAENKLSSNLVLGIIKEDAEKTGFVVESRSSRVKVPVLFGINGKPEKTFQADGFNSETKTVIEVEAGRAIDNNQVLKDLFEACVMHDIDYLIIAVRRLYRRKDDFAETTRFFDVMYASRRLSLPLKGIMVIGY